MTQEEMEALVDKELEETIKRVEKEKKKAEKSHAAGVLHITKSYMIKHEI